MIVCFFVITYIVLGLFLIRHINSINFQSIDLPFVSVILACKNEADNLPSSLSALSFLKYPQKKLEIIIVNDHSSDDSLKIIQSFARQYSNFKYINLTSSQKAKPGKAGAIMEGIENSKGEFIFITDADCIVPPTWIKGHLSLFNAEIGITGGFTLAEPSATSLFQSVQKLDLLYLLSVASATSSLNKPTSWVGNNIAIRRQAYKSIGGYAALEDSLVEDFILIAAMDKQTNWKSRFVPSPSTLVKSLPPKALSDWYNQRKRWSCGIPRMRPLGLLIMTVSFAAHLAVLLSLLTMPLLFFILGACIMAMFDYRLIRKTAQYLQYSIKVNEFIFFQVYYFLYSSLLPFFLIFDRTVTWKGKIYHTTRRKQQASL